MHILRVCRESPSKGGPNFLGNPLNHMPEDDDVGFQAA